MGSTRFRRLALLLWIASTPFRAVAANDLLSPNAEQYIGCFERGTIVSARKHIHDPEVFTSSFPEKVLIEIIYEDIGRSCGRFLDTISSGNGDLALATYRGYSLAQAAARMALAEAPPPPRVPVTGSGDYTHVEKLNDGAFESLSKECQALFDWNRFSAPASCDEDVRNANRREQQITAQHNAELLRTPNVRYCLGLPAHNNAGFGNDTFNGDFKGEEKTSHSSNDPFAAILNQDENEKKKLQVALDDPSERLVKCVEHIKAVGGLVFVDPGYELARVNQIPAVKQASEHYSKCTMDSASEFARVSNEPAETIAKAALGGCSPLREQYLSTLAKGLGIVMTLEIAAQEERDTTGALIGKVISARAANTLPRAGAQ